MVNISQKSKITKESLKKGKITPPHPRKWLDVSTSIANQQQKSIKGLPLDLPCELWKQFLYYYTQYLYKLWKRMACFTNCKMTKCWTKFTENLFLPSSILFLNQWSHPSLPQNMNKHERGQISANGISPHSDFGEEITSGSPYVHVSFAQMVRAQKRCWHVCCHHLCLFVYRRFVKLKEIV